MRGAFRVEGTPPPAPQKASTPPSRTSIAGRRVPVDRRGRARLRLKCGAGAGCKGTLTLTRGRTKLGSARYSVGAGRARALTVSLTPAARRLVRREGSLRATAAARSGGRMVKRAVELRQARR
jgi:hypothetical protein